MQTESVPAGPPSHKKRVSWHKRRTFEINNAGDFDQVDQETNSKVTGLIVEHAEAQKVTKFTNGGNMKGHAFNANAEDLCVGQMIRIREVPGVAWVMWTGGDMMGVELEGPFGNSDGYYEFEQRRFFKTPQNCAFFCAKDQCDFVFELQAAPRFRYRSHDLNVGDVVMVSKTIGVGVIRHSSSQLVGCELNAPVGESDGQHNGARYFQTKPNCAHFTHPSQVKKIEAEDLLNKLNETVERLQEIEQDLSRATGR